MVHNLTESHLYLCNKGERTGEFFSEKVISTSARQIHHALSGTSFSVWVGCISLSVSYCMYFMCAIVRIGPDLARQSDLNWLRSSPTLLWILMSSLSLPIHPQPRPSLCESLKDFVSVLFHLGPLAIFSFPVVVTANRIISLVFTAALGNYGWRLIHRYPTWIWETLAISWIIWNNCLSGCVVPDRSCTMGFWSLFAFSK